MDGRSSAVQSDRLSPSSPRGSRLKHSSGSKKRTRQSPIYKSIDSLKSEEELYEAPPGMPAPPQHPPPPARPGSVSSPAVAVIKDSESEYDPTYAYGAAGGGAKSVQQIYNASRCSSISATQSFDMRMYGSAAPRNDAANPGVGPAVAAGPGASATLKRNEETTEKLENPYYYYGSTRNQKKQGKTKPRPLLPSQRAQLEQAKKGMMGRPAATHVSAGAADSVIPPAFQRSRSLGGYYNQGRAAGQPIPAAAAAPARNQQLPRNPLIRQPLAAAGSMTPLSYSRWQHALQQEAGAQRGHNALYHDTPPTQRAAHVRMTASAEAPEGQPPYRRQLNHQHPSFFMPEIRRLAPPQSVGLAPPLRPHHQRQQQLLSPILTDAESGGSPKAMRRNFIPDDIDYDDDSEADDQFTSQATQGYSEGLADNESELSGHRGDPLENRRAKDLHLVSPLEYSAMLKLYGGGLGGGGTDFQRPAVPSKKDVTPDSGVVNSDSNKSRKSQLHAAPSGDSAQYEKTNKPMYSKIRTEDDQEDEYSTRGNTTVFSSSSDDSESELRVERQAPAKAQYEPLAVAGSPVPQVEKDRAAVAGYRWNGSRMSAAAAVVARQPSSDATSADDGDGDVADDEENDGDVSDEDTTTANIPGVEREVVQVCKDIQSSEFGSS